MYRICTTYNASWNTPHRIFMSIKISSDNMDHPKLEEALKKEHLDPVHEKARQILEEGKKITEYQVDELNLEDTNAQEQISTSRTYYMMTIIQVLIVMGLGLYQVFSFRKYLSSHDLI